MARNDIFNSLTNTLVMDAQEKHSEAAAVHPRSDEKLNALSAVLKADDIKFMIAPGAGSLDKCKEEAAQMIDRMQQFVEHGYSDAELDFKYKRVIIIE
jgi:hypothetical protein